MFVICSYLIFKNDISQSEHMMLMARTIWKWRLG